MSDLVRRLSEGEHAVELSLRPARTAEALKERLDSGYVHVKFPNTRGGTELGVRLDPALTDISGADFERGTGRVSLAGELTLDFVRVRCVAQVELSSFTGTGRLVPLDQPAA
jgi:hypothetical protein